MRLKRDFFVFGEAVTKSNNTCQYVKGVWLSIWYEHSASMCVKGVLLVLSYVESKEEQFSEVKKMHLVFS